MGEPVKRFIVRGKVTIEVSTLVEAADEDRAVEQTLFDVVADRAKCMPQPTDLIVEASAMHATEIPPRGPLG
jgi:hypothetical protein